MKKTARSGAADPMATFLHHPAAPRPDSYYDLPVDEVPRTDQLKAVSRVLVRFFPAVVSYPHAVQVSLRILVYFAGLEAVRSWAALWSALETEDWPGAADAVQATDWGQAHPVWAEAIAARMRSAKA